MAHCSKLLLQCAIYLSIPQVSLAETTPVAPKIETVTSTPTVEPPLVSSLAVQKIASRLGRITALVPFPTNPQSTLVVQGNGTISVLQDGTIQRKNFIDIEDLISSKNPESLFGLAFSRHFPVTRFAYLGFIDRQGDTVVGRFTVEPNDRVSDESLRVELKVVQTVQHQRTGAIAFGPDDALYVATGDGGSDMPAESSAQNPLSLLGKILRIEIGREEYTIPASNPFSTGAEYLPEIFAIGLRSPVQLLSSRHLLVLDHGKVATDEINVVAPKANFGWPLLEGEKEVHPGTPLSTDQTKPIVSYPRSFTQCLGASAELARKERRFLIYADCSSGSLFAREWKGDSLSSDTIDIGTSNQPTTALLVNENGDLLVGTSLGEVFLVTGILR